MTFVRNQEPRYTLFVFFGFVHVGFLVVEASLYHGRMDASEGLTSGVLCGNWRTYNQLDETMAHQAPGKHYREGMSPDRGDEDVPE